MQVLGNLLSNAARHSPESSAIRVSAVRQGGHVAVSVADEGRGIPADRLPHLFRKFSRIDAEDQGGDTSLGLAVCRGLVEAHGGRIWAESEGAGLGARVHLHASGGRRGRVRWPGGIPRSHRPGSAAGRRPAAHTGGGRRPSDAQVRAGRALQGGLLADGDRRPG